MTPSFVVTPDANARVQRCLDQFIVEHDTPGMQYLFLSADAVLYAYHGGMANLVDHVPVTSSTTFNLDSAVEPYCDRPMHRICARKIQNERSPYR